MAAAAPALAQDTDVVGDENVVTNEGDDTQYNAVCQNIIGSIGDIDQSQYGEADAVATNDSNTVAEVAQEQDVTIAQVNQCLNDFDEDGNGSIEAIEIVEVVEGGKVVATASASDSSSTSASSSPSVAAVTEIPETGGAGLLTLGAGVMVVGGGLVARRMMR